MEVKLYTHIIFTSPSYQTRHSLANRRPIRRGTTTGSMLTDQSAALIQVAIGNGEGLFRIRVHRGSPVQTQAQLSERRATGS